MDLGFIIAFGVVAFGFGCWFVRISSKINKIDKNLLPLTLLHRKELLEYYLEKGTLPNPGMTPRKQYLLDELQSGRISQAEYKELSDILEIEKKEAERTNNTEAFVAILGLIALIAVLSKLLKSR